MKRVLKRTCFFVLLVLIVSALSFVAYSQQSNVCPIAVYEGEFVQLNPEAYDPDPEIGPAGILLWEFGPPFNNKGQWQTMKGQRGIFNFWVSVSDGGLEDKNHSCVEVFPNNRDPILYPVPEMFITRGENTRISATCVDPDGDPVEISYKLDGKDILYVMYEPPGVYNLEIICSDGFGGVASERTKLHVLMPEVIKPAKQPKQQVRVQAPKEPEVIDLQLPEPETDDVIQDIDVIIQDTTKPEIIEVQYPAECPPCPSFPADENIDVIVYDSIEEISTKDQTRHFVIESEKDIPSEEKKSDDDCENNLKRKKEIDKIMARCC